MDNKLLLIGLLFLMGCSSTQKMQGNCKLDTVTQKCVYIFVEEMPIYNQGHSDFIKDILKSAKFNQSKKGEIITRINLQFVIDEKGNLIGARIKDKKDLSDFEIEFLNVINKLEKNWSPGVHNGIKVPVLLSFPVNIDINQE